MGEVERGKSHADDLYAQVGKYRELDPVAFTTTTNAEDNQSPTLEIKWVATVAHEVPAEFSLILGDVFTNLRGSLDHAVYSHAEKFVQATTGSPLDPKVGKKIAHKFSATSGDWTKGMKNTRPVVDPAFYTVMESQQQFSAQPDKRLTILDALANADKHRMLSIVQYAAPTFEMDLASLPGARLDHDPKQPIADGVTVATLTVPRPPGTSAQWVKWNGHIGYEEMIKDPDAPQSASLQGVVRALVEATKIALTDLQAAAGANW
ncbi:hypothetical protein [Nocardia aurantiaca]|uniref:Uncharacterized protein n=1 Tax=Nocardia aurantiaca TaxID=2675850 RepID=A0A6I3L7R1_9NOCA|nr:hypothetical protein [Nocardia aurantiaca]MTE17050.1 hypothetical protein [Nocardia aurantiaca]